MRKFHQRNGLSYKKRVADINAIYDQYAKMGISNREIWRRYIKRPGDGISPMRWNEVIGTKAVRNFEEDELIELCTE